MKILLNILFYFVLCQSVFSDNVLAPLGESSSVDTLASTFLEGGTNATVLNSTTLSSPQTGIYNCSNVANVTDLSQCTPINISQSYECTKVNYDFLIFSATWQPKLCNENSKTCASRPSDERAKWRISGLRGSFSNGTRPAQCCSDKQLRISELDPILSDLRKNWVYERESGAEESIIEDWNLHGSCVQEAEQKSTIDLYKKSLELANKLPFREWLSNAKIEPSNHDKYGLQFFNYTISSKLTKKYQMRCKTFDYEKKISIIDSINVCVDKFTSQIIDCPFDFDSNCLEKVYYPENLIEYQVPEEVFYRDMNYYRYNNYHRSYSPLMYPSSGFGGSGLLTGAAIGASGATAALALPAAYYYFKNQNKLKKLKYNNLGGAYSGGYGGSSMPWYSSSAFASNAFAQPSSYYGSPKNFGNLGTSNHNLYPRQPAPAYPSTLFSGVQGNKNFGNLNVPDLSPNFYNPRPSYPSYNSPSGYPSYPSYPPKYSPSYPSSNTGNLNVPSYPPYSNSASNPSYPAYPGSKPSYPAYGSSGFGQAPPPYSGSDSKPSYPAYGSSSAGQAPPPYSKYDKNSPYPKQDNPPSYSSIDKNKPSYPAYNSGSNNPYKPSAPSFSDVSTSNKDKSGSLYPKLPSDSSHSKPSYPAYPSSSSSSSHSSSSGSSSKPKSSGGIFGSIFGKITGSKSKSGGGSSYGRSSGGSGSRSRGGGLGRSRG